jgi:hypothetical protein
MFGKQPNALDTATALRIYSVACACRTGAISESVGMMEHQRSHPGREAAESASVATVGARVWSADNPAIDRLGIAVRASSSPALASLLDHMGSPEASPLLAPSSDEITGVNP